MLNVVSLGDPGLGKSQLLQAAAAVSPRGLYVCGNVTTNAGLTVAVVKDPMTSDYGFEAGTCFAPVCQLLFFSIFNGLPVIDTMIDGQNFCKLYQQS